MDVFLSRRARRVALCLWLVGLASLLVGCVPPVKKHDPVVVAAVAVNRPAPLFPPMAFRQQHEGTVLLSIVVDTQGATKNIQIEKSSGYPDLDLAATTAASQWTYKPETVDGTPREATVHVPVTFDMNSTQVAFVLLGHLPEVSTLPISIDMRDGTYSGLVGQAGFFVSPLAHHSSRHPPVAAPDTQDQLEAVRVAYRAGLLDKTSDMPSDAACKYVDSSTYSFNILFRDGMNFSAYRTGVWFWLGFTPQMMKSPHFAAIYAHASSRKFSAEEVQEAGQLSALLFTHPCTTGEKLKALAGPHVLKITFKHALPSVPSTAAPVRQAQVK